VSGNLGYDNIVIGGITAKGAEFLMASQLSIAFSLLPFDGILGLGFQSIAVGNVPPLIQDLINQD